MTLKEYMKHPNPLLDALAEQAERQREAAEDFIIDSKGNRRTWTVLFTDGERLPVEFSSRKEAEEYAEQFDQDEVWIELINW